MDTGTFPSKKILKSDETLIWATHISDEALRKRRTKDFRASLWMIGVTTVGAWLLAYRAASAWGERQQEAPVLGYLSLIFAVILLAGWIWLVSKTIRSMTHPIDYDALPRHYAITSHRLIATNRHGRIMDEMRRSDMEFFIDLGERDPGILVSRKDDPECTGSFHFDLIEGRETPEKIIKDILSERTPQ